MYHHIIAKTASIFLASRQFAATFVEAGLVEAGALSDPSKLRFQAVFMMGAGGSGKGFVSQRYLKYMPGGPSSEPKSPTDRGLSELKFDKIVESMRSKGFNIEVVEGGSGAKIPFRLYTYDHKGGQRVVPPSEWDSLPPNIAKSVEGLSELIFSTPKNELPSYWRQADPDTFKAEIPGYDPKNPGYVHEMSSEMSKAYVEAVFESGDPVIIDGTGQNPKKMADLMKKAKASGYRVSLVYVLVPLTVNQIRNAVRARNVDPDQITRQWKDIGSSFDQIRTLADKAKVVINRNDDRDIEAYKKHKDQINSFIRSKTGFDSLYAYIAKVQPSDLHDWGRLLSEQ